MLLKHVPVTKIYGLPSLLRGSNTCKNSYRSQLCNTQVSPERRGSTTVCSVAMLTIKHIMLACVDSDSVRTDHFNVDSMKELFE